MKTEPDSATNNMRTWCKAYPYWPFISIVNPLNLYDARGKEIARVYKSDGQWRCWINSGSWSDWQTKGQAIANAEKWSF